MSFAADTPLAVPLSQPAPPSGPVRFADRGGLFGLLVKNAFLTLITLGVYRFWARAALRRYWWGSVVLAGDPLEYIGTGLELFIGFLMFLGIMLPFGMVYGLTALLQQTNPIMGGVLRLIEFVGLFVLIQFVTFRARRYRLSRTLWRGVRASQDGTSGEYLRLVMKWTLISTVTLGIAIPWARMATTRYLTDRTALGDLQARFHGHGRDLFLPFFVPGAVAIGSIVIFFSMNIAFLAHPTVGAPHGMWLVFIGYFAAIFGFFTYLLVELRYTIRHTHFGEVELGSALSIGKILLHIVGFAVVAFLVLVVAILVTTVPLAGLGIAHPTPGAPTLPPGVVISLLVTMVLALALINILRIFWIDRLIVRQICDTLSMTHTDVLDRIGQSTAPIPSAGEGMADAFDIGAF